MSAKYAKYVKSAKYIKPGEDLRLICLALNGRWAKTAANDGEQRERVGLTSTVHKSVDGQPGGARGLGG